MQVNGVALKTFVDSGAQVTIMSQSCAERCGLLRLMDTRFQGTAVGVGSAKILGEDRTHGGLKRVTLGRYAFKPSAEAFHPRLAPQPHLRPYRPHPYGASTGGGAPSAHLYCYP